MAPSGFFRGVLVSLSVLAFRAAPSRRAMGSTWRLSTGKGALTALGALCLTNLDDSDVRKFDEIWSVLPTQLVCILVLASKCLAAVGGEKECDVHVQYLLAFFSPVKESAHFQQPEHIVQTDVFIDV